MIIFLILLTIRSYIARFGNDLMFTNNKMSYNKFLERKINDFNKNYYLRTTNNAKDFISLNLKDKHFIINKNHKPSTVKLEKGNNGTRLILDSNPLCKISHELFVCNALQEPYEFKLDIKNFNGEKVFVLKNNDSEDYNLKNKLCIGVRENRLTFTKCDAYINNLLIVLLSNFVKDIDDKKSENKSNRLHFNENDSNINSEDNNTFIVTTEFKQNDSFEDESNNLFIDCSNKKNNNPLYECEIVYNILKFNDTT